MKAFHRVALLCTIYLCFSCQDHTDTKQNETAAIIKTLNNETKYAYSRDYPNWADQWIQEPFVCKTYINMADSSVEELRNWTEIDNFIKDYFKAHPKPDPLPELLKDVTVRVYGTGAWVTYEQRDPTEGLKRETRLMEKSNGKWKIAGMHTTIYGFK